ncbi:uncharacterized protein LOC110242371 [Exaiptasia diaphana]|uniref:Uncharacterized protein n=1 Tax=Exaiptasia diaphana TaxID=2652724 RepID=A0A913XGF0_EXADI|nr:uncharacterized protein LOC110242371 [Exaiptasia diaphana]
MSLVAWYKMSKMSKQKATKNMSTRQNSASDEFKTLSPTASTSNITSKDDTDPAIVGYLHNVSPVKKSAKGSEYFSFSIQEKKRTVKAICFSPKKHKSNVEQKAESSTPCKLTNFAPSASEQNVIWINNNTQINDAIETTVDFSFNASSNSPTAALVTTKDLEKIQIFQAITIRGLIVFGGNQPESIPTKPDLIKKEGLLLDKSGKIRITLWNEQIQRVEEGFYSIENIRLRQFKGEKYLSGDKETLFTKLTENVPQITNEEIKDAQEALKTSEIILPRIHTADIAVFYTCLTCSKTSSLSARIKHAKVPKLQLKISYRGLHKNNSSSHLCQEN